MASKSEPEENPQEAIQSSKYDSIFAPGVQVTIAEYITEILLANFLNWQKQPKPQSAFWRKDIKDKNENLKKLTQKFVAELTVIRQLIQVFSPSVVAKYFAEHKCVGYRTVKKETRQRILEGLFEAQLDFNRRMWNKTTVELEKLEDKREFTKPRENFKTKNRMDILGG